MSKLAQGTAPFWFKILKKILYRFNIIAVLSGGNSAYQWAIKFYKERGY